MIENKTGFVIHDAFSLENEINNILSSTDIKKNIQAKQLEYLQNQSGATQRILDQLF